MQYRIIALFLVLTVLLSGCGLLDGEYLSVTPHHAQLTGTQSGNLNAANYHELRQILAELVSVGTENAVIHVAEYPQDKVESGMDAAVHYLRVLLPLGAYALEDLKYEIGTVGGKPAVSVTMSYLHGRSELRKIKAAADMPEAEALIADVLDQCGEGVVLLVEKYTETDLVQMVQDYAEEHPERIMELPQVAVGVYPDSGVSRVVEIKFTYQTSRESLRQMQTQVNRVFSSAALYVNSDGDEQQKFDQFYTFLMERFDYKMETSITPSYSLLCHGVGDSKALASAYAAMCREAGLDCRVVSGTHAGEARFWNLIRVGEEYRHVDLPESKAAGQLKLMTDEEMQGYVWDYSAYPAAGSDAVAVE